ncbi:SDR family oxidoreductase [Bacteroidota bacterium]
MAILNKTVLITGSTDGIGKQIALELAQKGAKVLIHGRDKSKCVLIQDWINNITGVNNVNFFTSDFSSLKEVNNLALELNNKLNRLDVLINNAGVYMKKRELSTDGYELTFAVNHLAHFLLTNQLLDLLKRSNYARIINISSIAHSNAKLDWNNLNCDLHFDGYYAYALSKLLNIMYTYELAERVKEFRITVNCLHPGVINTKLLHAGFNITGASLEEGAKTSVYLADSDDVERETGKYFIGYSERFSSDISYNKEFQKKLWDISERFCNIKYKPVNHYLIN